MVAEFVSTFVLCTGIPSSLAAKKSLTTEMAIVRVFTENRYLIVYNLYERKGKQEAKGMN